MVLIGNLIDGPAPPLIVWRKDVSDSFLGHFLRLILLNFELSRRFSSAHSVQNRCRFCPRWSPYFLHVHKTLTSPLFHYIRLNWLYLIAITLDIGRNPEGPFSDTWAVYLVLWETLNPCQIYTSCLVHAIHCYRKTRHEGNYICCSIIRTCAQCPSTTHKLYCSSFFAHRITLAYQRAGTQ